MLFEEAIGSEVTASVVDLGEVFGGGGVGVELPDLAADVVVESAQLPRTGTCSALRHLKLPHFVTTTRPDQTRPDQIRSLLFDLFSSLLFSSLILVISSDSDSDSQCGLWR